METLPINTSHPFWSATTGSKLKLAFESKTMIISVYSVAKPYVYKLEFQNEESFHNKKTVIKIMKNEWWKHYGARTVVEFEKHNNFDLSGPNYKLSDSTSSLDSCSVNSSLDSVPSSPSPQSVRKSSLRINLSKKNLSVDTKSHKSPRSDSPRSNNSQSNSSKTTPRSSSSSSNASPRSVSDSSSPRYDSSSTTKSPRYDSKTFSLLKKVSDKLLNK